jgi:glycosyltransferase involved in cell wall biosynthesis
MDISFSILIPAYKSAFFSEAIQSVLNQTYNNFELVIVDDCSPENLKSIVDEFSDSRIHYHRNNRNYGALDVVDNWNQCLSYASGDYVICMGDDDKLTPSCLADYVEIINKYPGLYVYHTRTVIIDEISNISDIQELRPEYESGYSLWWHRWNGRLKQYIGDFLFSRKHLLENGGFIKLPLAWASDDITAVRASMLKGIANVQNVGFMYRSSSYTISMSSNERIKAEATLAEKEWYSNLISTLTPEGYSDKIMFAMLKRDFDIHFRNKLMLTLVSDIKQNPFRVVYWLRNCSKYMLLKTRIIYMFVRTLVFYVFS